MTANFKLLRSLGVVIMLTANIAFGQVVCNNINPPDILFDHNSSDLTQKKFRFNSFTPDTITSRESVEIYHNFLVKYPTYQILLEGHASFNESNPTELSLKRAESLANVLVTKGISRTRITTKGVGASQLISSKTSIKKAKTKLQADSLHQCNRRVVIKVTSF
jgi:outer membrane protein OmpA-like peptidoglycan-associated protein